MTSDIQAAPAAPSAPEKTGKNTFQRIVGVLFAPNDTFEDIARKPDVLLPLLIILIIGTVVSVLMLPHIDVISATRDALEARGNMSQEDIDRVVRFTTAFTKIMTWVSPFLSALFYAIAAGILLIAFRMFAGEGTYKQAFSVTIYSWLPQVIFSIILVIVVMSRGTVPAEQLNSSVLSNLAFLTDFKEHRVLYSFLSSFDIFNIWTLALLILGMSAVSRLSRVRSAVIVISLWAVMILIKVGFAALGAARMKAGA